MPRFFVPPESIRGQSFTLTGSEARHAALVLRKKVADVIDFFDGKDLSYQGRIDSITPERIDGTILSQMKSAETPAVDLILCQALIKGPKWDWLVEKACEIGVTQLVPLVTARTVVKPSRDNAYHRWTRIALAASKQCGRADVMDVSKPIPLNQALDEIPQKSLALIPWEKEQHRSIRSALAVAQSSSPAVSGRGSMASPSPLSPVDCPVQEFLGRGTPEAAGNDDRAKKTRVTIFIGPEGGWEDEEVDQAVCRGTVSVRLGPTLLRSETAGLVAAALVLGELGIYS